MNNKSPIIIAFEETKPKYFGSSGMHLYAVKLEEINNQYKIDVSNNAIAVTLYKAYWDLAIFLSNSLNPSHNNTTIETYPIFGNSKHKENLICTQENEDFKIVGLLDDIDVSQVSNFFKSNSLENMEGVKAYFEKLKPEVKEELEILLDEDLFPSMQSYLVAVSKFIRQCEENKMEALIIYSA